MPFDPALEYFVQVRVTLQHFVVYLIFLSCLLNQ